MTRWHLRSLKINEVVHASDQFAAFDTLRDRPVEDFGMIVSAEPNEAGNDASIPARTSLLMFRWGRDDEARRFVARMVELGMPDTTEADLLAVGR